MVSLVEFFYKNGAKLLKSFELCKENSLLFLRNKGAKHVERIEGPL